LSPSSLKMLPVILVSIPLAVLGPSLLKPFMSNEKQPRTLGSSSGPRTGRTPFRRHTAKNVGTLPALPPAAQVPPPTITQALCQPIFICGELHSQFESGLVEFKAAQSRYNRSLHGMFDRYACAFLNVSGGELWLGVEDDGAIIGIDCSRERYDRLCLRFDDIATKGFEPAIDPALYSVEIVELFERTPTGSVVKSARVLLRLTFRPNPNGRIVYRSHRFGYAARGSASVRPLTPSSVADRQAFGRPGPFPPLQISSSPAAPCAVSVSKKEIQSCNVLSHKSSQVAPPALRFPSTAEEYEAGQRASTSPTARSASVPSRHHRRRGPSRRS
jgi:hypothetical protein